jgi:uncharacterized protein (TIGR02452 family)
MSRSIRATIANETVKICELGRYEIAGQQVDIGGLMSRCLQETKLFRPEELDDLLAQTGTSSAGSETEFEVTNETTLSAALRLVAECGHVQTLCLNFASAKNPGGSFLGGSQAQEESLARSSGLYPSLQSQWSYYEANRDSGTALYTDHMILSCNVPVFRDDAGGLLANPYCVAMLTAPAVNAGAMWTNEPHRQDLIQPTMAARIAKVLAVAASHSFDHLILGAWGCGVFRNDPSKIAKLFSEAFRGDDRFHSRFKTVVFAVLDNTTDESTIGPFRQHLAAQQRETEKTL